MVQRVGPFHQIVDAQVQRAISRGVERGRHPVLVLELILDQLVTGAAVGHDVRLGDDPGGAHLERTKDQLLKNVTVKLSRYAMYQDAEQEISRVAVGPALARRKVQGPR